MIDVKNIKATIKPYLEQGRTPLGKTPDQIHVDATGFALVLSNLLSRLPDTEIVCICGSTRFIGHMAVEAWRLEKQGVMVLSCHLLPSWYTDVEHHLAEAEGVAHILDALHRKKIDMADRILVVNVGGYIGNQTKREIDYAEKTGKPIQFQYLENGQCEHGKGLTDYCEPCGRITGG